MKAAQSTRIAALAAGIVECTLWRHARQQQRFRWDFVLHRPYHTILILNYDRDAERRIAKGDRRHRRFSCPLLASAEAKSSCRK